MTTATTNPPAIPPRPSRSQEKASLPMVPPRPTNRRFQRSASPNHDRFAPSPLISETAFVKKPNSLQPGSYHGPTDDPIPRSTSVELPSLGQEGMEYAALAEELASPDEGSADPEQTRTVAEDLKLHAPKPSLPAASAKQRVMAVTRTDSERAAQFGIGRASSVEESTPALPSNRSLKKKASTASQLSATDAHFEDEHGIPEIGQQVPMYKNAGDVQAPSPAPVNAESPKGRHHARKTSGRGLNLPPGSYGLHGHGVAPQDKLEKAYYEKHPDLLKKEHMPHHYDRPNDFSMSRDDLNKIVRETASRGSGLGTKNYTSTPSDQIGWQALEESASRIASPGVASPELKPAPIHVDEPERRRSAMFSDTGSVNIDEEPEPYRAPILADDEVAKDPSSYHHQPAVEPPAFELEEPSSRPTSRPGSMYKETSFELRSTPLEDVQEYEPLFKDDEKLEEKEETKHRNSHPHRFPSADIWEDAPSSVFYTAEVSTPELFDEREKPSPAAIPPPREGETPAHAFARHQEELAEKEAHGQRSTHKPLWAQHQKHLASEIAPARPTSQQRFPSRDIWEDAPESLQLETTVSTPQQDEDAPSPTETNTNLKPGIPPRPQSKSPEEKEKPSIPARPQSKSPANEKPAIPIRPKPRQTSSDDKPAVPRSKPQIPARPAKAGPTSAGLEPAEAAAPPPRQKPAVPARPVGGKIAALQAGFMSDLNRRLQLGPQAPPVKKEEESEGADGGEKASEVKEKVPLSDARKGRARGPQRRAPAKAATVPVAVAAGVGEKKEVVVCGFVGARTFFEIEPVEGVLSAGGVGEVKGGGEVVEGKSEEAVVEGRSEDVQVERKSEEVQVAASNLPVASPVKEEKREEEDKVSVGASKREDVSEPEAKPKDDPDSETQPEPETPQETKSLATNMAGETLISAEVKKDEEPEVKPDLQPKSEAESEPAPESEPQPEPEKQEETKSLATNMAGETLVKEEVKKDEEREEVEPVKVVEN